MYWVGMMDRSQKPPTGATQGLFNCNLGQTDGLKLNYTKCMDVKVNSLTKLATGQALQQVLHGIVINILLISAIATGSCGVSAMKLVWTFHGHTCLHLIGVPIATKLVLRPLCWQMGLSFQRGIHERRVVWNTYCDTKD